MRWVGLGGVCVCVVKRYSLLHRSEFLGCTCANVVLVSGRIFLLGRRGCCAGARGKSRGKVCCAAARAKIGGQEGWVGGVPAGGLGGRLPVGSAGGCSTVDGAGTSRARYGRHGVHVRVWVLLARGGAVGAVRSAVGAADTAGLARRRGACGGCRRRVAAARRRGGCDGCRKHSGAVGVAGAAGAGQRRDCASGRAMRSGAGGRCRAGRREMPPLFTVSRIPGGVSPKTPFF